MSLLVIIEIQTTPANEAEFLRIARQLATAAATEADTLRYDWFSTPTPGLYRVVEEYTSADAAEAHNNHVGPLLGQIFGVAEIVSASFFGELNDYLRAWAASRPGIAVSTPLPDMPRR